MSPGFASTHGDEQWAGSTEMAEQPVYTVTSATWYDVRGVIDADGGMPLEISVDGTPEDVDDEGFFLEHIKPREGEPTLSTEEVEQELGKDDLL